MSVLEGTTFPDAVRGVEALLDGVDLMGFRLRPVLWLPDDAFSPRTDGAVTVHVQREAITVGAVDRVEEVRLTVYGPDPLTSSDLAEAILAFICGRGIETPATEHSDSFYFDSIDQRVGPTPLDYPNTSVFPVVTVVAARARPMTFN